MLNKIMLIGYVGRDPEANVAATGTAVSKFTLGVTRRWKASSGEAREETEWFTIIAWNRLAEICDQYVRKGKKVYIEGRLTQRTYKDREGIARVAVEVIANEMELLSPREASNKPAQQESEEEIEALLAELERESE